MTEYNFQKELKKSILNADEKLDRKELLIDIFKAYTAKMFEHVLGRKGENRLEFDALVVVKRNLISEFRKTELGEYQKSVKWYEDLFEDTIKEIFNEAAQAHEGVDSTSINQSLEINPDAYVKEGGLFVPEHMKNI